MLRVSAERMSWQHTAAIRLQVAVLYRNNHQHVLPWLLPLQVPAVVRQGFMRPRVASNPARRVQQAATPWMTHCYKLQSLTAS